MASQRQLRSKITSVRNIKQITRAMQMVAATKMRRAEEVAIGARPYAKEALDLLSQVIAQNGIALDGPLTVFPESDRDCLVAVTSDKGLAGAYNSAVLRMAWNRVEEAKRQGREMDVIAVGRKARDFFSKRGRELVAEFLRFSDVVSIHDIDPLAERIFKAFTGGEYSRVYFCSTIFVSALSQRAQITQLLPLEPNTLRSIVEGIIPKTGKYSEILNGENGEKVEYVLEPSQRELAECLTEDLARVEIAHLLFESNASEHASRMIAMKNATENAESLQQDLTLQLNKARQAGITREVAEISTAKEALQSEV